MLTRLRELLTGGRGATAAGKVICGLGNPGPRYANTRHNTGYRVVAALAAARGGVWSRFGEVALVCGVEFDGQPVLLVKPLTYMNASGLAVRPVLRRWRVAPTSLLVVSDDLDLPLGVLRLRPGGSAGGHRGLQSIIESLGTRDFPRLRCGIGRPPEGTDPADYVLSPFTLEEREQLERVLERAAAAAACWVGAGIETAMNLYNK